MAFGIRRSKQENASLEILKFPAGLDAIKSVVLDASTVAPDANGDRILKAGTILAKNARNQYQRYQGAGSGSSANEVQTATVTGSPTGGTFTLTFGGETTNPIAYNAAAATVQAELLDFDVFNPGDLTVTGSAGGPYTVTFGGDFAATDVDALTASGAGLTGGTTPDVTIATSTAGTGGQFTIAGILGTDQKFADGTAASDKPADMFFHGCVFRADRIVDYGTYGATVRSALNTCKFE